MAQAGQKRTRNTKKSTKSEPPDIVVAADKLDEELAWCIQQLQMGLSDPLAKPDSRKVKEATKVMKILQNPNAPLVKKRQAMRMTFGDYRKKMREEEKKYLASVKKMSLSTASEKKQQQSTFFKRAQVHNPSLRLADGSDPFTFNFAVSELAESGGDDCSCKPETAMDPNPGACGDENSVLLHALSLTDSTDAAAADGGVSVQQQQSQSAIAVNYYKMNISGGSNFQFNFAAEEGDGS